MNEASPALWLPVVLACLVTVAFTAAALLILAKGAAAWSDAVAAAHRARAHGAAADTAERTAELADEAQEDIAAHRERPVPSHADVAEAMRAQREQTNGHYTSTMENDGMPDEPIPGGLGEYR